MPVHLLPGETYKIQKNLSVPPTAEERVLIAVVSAVVVAVAQVFREDADVGGVTLDLAVGTNPVGCKDPNTHHRIETVEPAVAFFTRGEVFTTVIILYTATSVTLCSKQA